MESLLGNVNLQVKSSLQGWKVTRIIIYFQMGASMTLFPSHRLLWISYTKVLNTVIDLHSIIQTHSKWKVNHRIVGSQRSCWVSSGTTACLPFCTCFNSNSLFCRQSSMISVVIPIDTCKNNSSVFLWKNHTCFSVTIWLCFAFPKGFYNMNFIILEYQTLSSVAEE